MISTRFKDKIKKYIKIILYSLLYIFYGLLPEIPSSQLNTVIFVLGIFATIVWILITWKLHKFKFIKDKYFLLIPVFRYVLTLATTFPTIFAIYKETKTIQGIVTIILVVIIIVSFIGILVEFLLKLLQSIKDPNEIKNSNEKIDAYGYLFGTVLAGLLAPGFIFGSCYLLILTIYDHFYDNNHNNSLQDLIDQIYMSFIITYALPSSKGSLLANNIDYINSHTWSRLLVIVHILFSKMTDLTVISIAISYINRILKKNKTRKYTIKKYMIKNGTKKQK